jgi:hypothetical protein
MRPVFLLAVLSSGALALALAAESRGQYPPYSPYAPYNRPSASPYVRPPVLSPYLDLVRGRNTPAINFYLGYRPEIQRRQDAAELRQLQRDFASSQRAPESGPEDEEPTPRLAPTGHPTFFMNASPYYPSTGTAPQTARPLPQQQQRPLSRSSRSR